mmetsp:Transcript_13746/g.37876  ORF Transcript_13746/g.37876 Transcript_13746/m.37876 type:complete len:213 (-) Transcript_13746:192-830(-)
MWVRGFQACGLSRWSRRPGPAPTKCGLCAEARAPASCAALSRCRPRSRCRARPPLAPPSPESPPQALGATDREASPPFVPDAAQLPTPPLRPKSLPQWLAWIMALSSADDGSGAKTSGCADAPPRAPRPPPPSKSCRLEKGSSPRPPPLSKSFKSFRVEKGSPKPPAPKSPPPSGPAPKCGAGEGADSQGGGAAPLPQPPPPPPKVSPPPPP